VPTFSSAAEGFEWLMQGDARRWMVVREKDVAQLNSLYRKHAASAAVAAGGSAIDGSVGRGPSNLPVLDARSSEILLVSNQIRPGEVSQNPFRDFLPDVRPQPRFRVDANLGDQLECLGWEIATPEGRVVETISPGQSYVFSIYYEVIRPLSGAWETFIHIDGYRRRFNGDHKTLEGKYPCSLWRPGDYVADRYPFRLDPNFTPGTYQAFFGLFLGSRRLEVKRGLHDEDRVRGGSVVVR
jgi:hypothetical protein